MKTRHYLKSGLAALLIGSTSIGGCGFNLSTTSTTESERIPNWEKIYSLKEIQDLIRNQKPDISKLPNGDIIEKYRFNIEGKTRNDWDDTHVYKDEKGNILFVIYFNPRGNKYRLYP